MQENTENSMKKFIYLILTAFILMITLSCQSSSDISVEETIKSDDLKSTAIPAIVLSPVSGLGLGEYSDVFDRNQEILRSHPYNFDANAMIGHIYLVIGGYDDAIRHLQRASEIGTDNKVALFQLRSGLELARQLNRDSKLPGYVDRHDEAIKVYLNNIGTVYDHKEEAQIHFDMAQEYRFSYDHSIDGRVYRKNNAYSDAIFHFEEAIKLDPNYFDAAAQLGNLHLEMRQFPDAIHYYNKALSIESDDYVVVEEIKVEEVKRNLAKAQEVSGQVFFLQGMDYLEQGLLDEAIFNLSKHVELDPDHFESNFAMGEVFLRRADFENAFKYFKKAAELRPDHFETSAMLAHIYLDTGRYSEAIYKFNETLKIPTDNYNAERDVKRGLEKAQANVGR